MIKLYITDKVTWKSVSRSWEEVKVDEVLGFVSKRFGKGFLLFTDEVDDGIFPTLEKQLKDEAIKQGKEIEITYL